MTVVTVVTVVTLMTVVTVVTVVTLVKEITVVAVVTVATKKTDFHNRNFFFLQKLLHLNTVLHIFLKKAKSQIVSILNNSNCDKTQRVTWDSLR